MRPELSLSADELGLLFSAGLLGLMPGALFGGRLADTVGRRPVLIGALVLFGLFSVLTSFAATSFGALLAVRIATGVGLGAALPVLVVMVSEAAPPKYRNLAVGLMYAGMPIGGLFVSAVGLVIDGRFWRYIFYTGGATPLVIAILMLAYLPETKLPREGANPGHSTAAPIALSEALFGQGRAITTLAAWAAFFLTSTVVYSILNWLPLLLSARGFASSHTALVQAMLNVGSVFGIVVIGLALDRLRPIVVALSAYAGMALCLFLLARPGSLTAVACIAVGAGFFIMGAQSMLFALATKCFPQSVRGSSLGAAVAVGRLGAIVGPFMVGLMLSSGFDTFTVLMAASPLIAGAALAAVPLGLASARVNQHSPVTNDRESNHAE